MGRQMGVQNREPLSEKILRTLYVDEKCSAREIAKRLHCSEHKVNYWFLKYNIHKRSLSDAIYLANNPHGDPFQIKKIQTLKDAQLFGLGIGLYWGEGNKKNKNAVRLGNTDPNLIRAFIKFLIEICGVKTKKLRFGLQIFSDMPKEKVLQFWLDSLKGFKISRDQFFKVTVTPHRGIGNYREKSKYGVLTVYMSNSKLKRIIDGLLPL